MLPRNVLAIRKSFGSAAASEIITSVTSKSSNATLLEYPTGAYTGMRTFDRIGIMDFSGHADRLASSLQQIKFSTPASSPSPSPSAIDSSSSSDDSSNGVCEDEAATIGLAQLRNEDIMKKETRNLVKAGLAFYYKQLKQNVQNGELKAIMAGETKITILCTWDAKASLFFCGLYYLVICLHSDLLLISLYFFFCC